MATKTRRKEQRITVTVKLSVVEDADLIEWLTGFPRGERHAAMKTALREAMETPRRDALSRLADKTERIWQTISDLPTWLERLRQGFVVEQAAAAGEAEAIPRLDAQALADRAARMKKAKW